MITMLRTIHAYVRLSAHLLKVFFSLVHGIYKISKLQYAPVTIFGGTHLSPESIYIKKAAELSSKLAINEIPVITGGGPGIMEAANCGAIAHKKNVIITMGITVKGLDGGMGVNKCAQESSIEVDYYFARKWLLVNYSLGFAVFPGGFGTMDELMELLTLIQTNMRKKAPIVLIGIEYWRPFMDWINNSALKNNMVKPEHVELFSITDSVDEAFSLLETNFKEKKAFSVFE